MNSEDFAVQTNSSLLIQFISGKFPSYQKSTRQYNVQIYFETLTERYNSTEQKTAALLFTATCFLIIVSLHLLPHKKLVILLLARTRFTFYTKSFLRTTTVRIPIQLTLPKKKKK